MSMDTDRLVMIKGRSSKRVGDALKRMLEDNRRSLEATTKEIQRLEDGLVREAAAQPSAPQPRDTGGSHDSASFVEVPHPRLVYCEKQDVIDRYQSGEITERVALRLLDEQGIDVFSAMELLGSWS